MKILIWLVMSGIAFTLAHACALGVIKKHGEDHVNDKLTLAEKIWFYIYLANFYIIFFGGGIYLFFEG